MAMRTTAPGSCRRRKGRRTSRCRSSTPYVDGVGLQRRHALQQRPERQCERRHDDDNQADHDGQDEEVHVGLGALGEAEEELVLRLDLDVELGAKTNATTTASSNGEGEIGGFQPRRPRMMPRPMPRKLAISRKLLKKPMYLTFAGIQRMSSSSTKRMRELVRNSRTGFRPSARSGCLGRPAPADGFRRSGHLEPHGSGLGGGVAPKL